MADGHVRWVQQMNRDDVEFTPCATPLEPQKCQHGPDYDFGSSPILANLPGGGRILMAGQKSGVVHGVDPDHDGKIVWQTRIGKGGYEGGIEFGMATDGKLLYAPLSDFQFKLAMSGEAGARATIMGVPTLLDPTSGGGLFALDLATGSQIWHAPPADCHGRTDCSPAQTAAPSVIPGVVFSGAIDGHMRAYSTADGRVLWDIDTNQTYQTVNGVPGHGGSIDGPGPVIVDGVVYTNSGYGYVGEATGNVLLAFTIDGK
jgi:polyvinyl alcohol dehydrogenase (cytochrome)